MARKPSARSKPTKKTSRKGAKAKPVAQAVVYEDAQTEAPAADAEPEIIEAEMPEPELPVPARAPEPEAPLKGPMSLTEQFLLVALREDWDDRMERVGAGRQGAAMIAAVLLDLAVRGRLRMHRDRFDLAGEPTGDAALDNFASGIEAMGNVPSQQLIERLGKKATALTRPWKSRLARRGFAREETWRFLGLFPRSRMRITDADAKGQLENRLVRTMAGGGTPDAQTIALLGLIDAAGLLPELVPDAALAYNRRRIQGLLSGRDPLGYKVDPMLRNVSDAALESILRNVRVLQGTGN
jgi:hypothetical protein